MKEQARRVLMWVLSPRLLRGSAATIGAAGEARDLAAVGQNDLTGLREMGAVLCGPAFDGDLIAFLDRVAIPTGAEKMIGAAEFKIPDGDDTFGVFDVEVHAGMRIGPLDFSHNTGDGDGFLGVVLGGEGVMG